MSQQDMTMDRVGRKTWERWPEEARWCILKLESDLAVAKADLVLADHNMRQMSAELELSRKEIGRAVVATGVTI